MSTPVTRKLSIKFYFYLCLYLYPCLYHIQKFFILLFYCSIIILYSYFIICYIIFYIFIIYILYFISYILYFIFYILYFMFCIFIFYILYNFIIIFWLRVTRIGASHPTYYMWKLSSAKMYCFLLGVLKIEMFNFSLFIFYKENKCQKQGGLGTYVEIYNVHLTLKISVNIKIYYYMT